jgi:dTMP kinase
MRGAFILFEGLDRSGKTTQAVKLVESLNSLGKPSKFYRFPDRTTRIGQMINNCLVQKEKLPIHALHLLFSANRWEVAEQITKDIKDGIHVVVDRYIYSGIAFSAAQGLDLEWCKGADKGLLLPDVVLFLDVGAEIAKTRGGFGEEVYEKEEFQNKVREMFKLLRNGDPLWKEINAADTVDAVHREISEIALKTIENVADKELRYV